VSTIADDTAAVAEETSGEAETAWWRLESLLQRMPVPAAPPRYPSVGVSVGVSFLDVALNLNHLTRRSQTLTTIDRAQLARDVTVEVSLDRLTPAQYTAGLTYGRLRDSAGVGARPLAQAQLGDGADAFDAEHRAPLVWIPVMRVSRSVAAPIRVYDTEGREVPRATQPELLPIVNAALQTLLQLILRSDPDAEKHGTEVHRLLHRSDRARWLLQGAIASMIQASHPAVPIGRPAPTGQPTADADGGIRTLARDVASKCVRSDVAFLELLYQASVEYLVVVGVTSSKKEHYLSYAAPTLPATPSSVVRLPLRRTLRGLRPSGREFVLEFRTYLPRSLDSFHVTVEAEPGIRVREAILTTDHDHLRAESAASALGELAQLVQTGAYTAEAQPFIEYEASSALAGLDDLLIRRARDWTRHGMQSQDGARLTPAGGHADITVVDALPDERARTLYDALVGVRHADYAVGAGQSPCTADELSTMSSLVRELGLAKDLVADDDPREHAAHLYWRHDGLRPPVSSPTAPEANVKVVFADDAPALINSVLGWLAGLCALVAVVGALLFGWPSWIAPWSVSVFRVDLQRVQVDALVAVLLIVPTVLFNRLDLPSTNTIAGQLRVLERVLGYAAIVLTGSLGLVLAIELDSPNTTQNLLALVFIALVILLVLALIDAVAGRYKRRVSRLSVLHPPGWVMRAGKRRRRPDAVFESLTHLDRDRDPEVTRHAS